MQENQDLHYDSGYKDTFVTSNKTQHIYTKTYVNTHLPTKT